jgi:Fe2+ transport system protein FeoA
MSKTAGSTAGAMTLWNLHQGRSGVVSHLTSELSEALGTRLTDLGFRAGQRVHCIHRPGFGAPRVYRVNGSTYSLDNQLAEQVVLIDDSTS